MPIHVLTRMTEVMAVPASASHPRDIRGTPRSAMAALSTPCGWRMKYHNIPMAVTEMTCGRNTMDLTME